MDGRDRAQLWEELRHQTPEEKDALVAQLARERTSDSVATLVQILEHESWFLRERAARALVNLGELVVAPLLEHLRSGLWYTRAMAASTLGRIGDPRAAPGLTDLIRDANRTVRDATLDGLAALAADDRGAHAVASAIHALPERTRRFALEGLIERDQDAADAVRRWLADPAQLLDPGAATRARAVGDDDSLIWEDVVGRRDAP